MIFWSRHSSVWSSFIQTEGFIRNSSFLLKQLLIFSKKCICKLHGLVNLIWTISPFQTISDAFHFVSICFIRNFHIWLFTVPVAFDIILTLIHIPMSFWLSSNFQPKLPKSSSVCSQIVKTQSIQHLSVIKENLIKEAGELFFQLHLIFLLFQITKDLTKIFRRGNGKLERTFLPTKRHPFSSWQSRPSFLNFPTSFDIQFAKFKTFWLI